MCSCRSVCRFAEWCVVPHETNSADLSIGLEGIVQKKLRMPLLWEFVCVSLWIFVVFSQDQETSWYCPGLGPGQTVSGSVQSSNERQQRFPWLQLLVTPIHITRPRPFHSRQVSPLSYCLHLHISSCKITFNSICILTLTVTVHPPKHVFQWDPHTFTNALGTELYALKKNCAR